LNVRSRENNTTWTYVSPLCPPYPYKLFKQPAVYIFESAMFLDPERNPKCNECQTMDIDPTYMKVFNCLVCKVCQNEKPEKYSLLTKTECKAVCPYLTFFVSTRWRYSLGLPTNWSYVVQHWLQDFENNFSWIF
jgi:hypothetical protein